MGENINKYWLHEIRKMKASCDVEIYDDLQYRTMITQRWEQQKVPSIIEKW